MHKIPTTREQLIDWFEETFDCAQGAGWMYAEERPDGYQHAIVRTVSGKVLQDASHKLTPYVVYGLRAPDTQHVERDLVIALHGRFFDFVRRHPEVRGTRLYWRHAWKVEVEEGRIYTRFVIPSLIDDGTLPVHEEGHELEVLLAA